VQSVRQALRQPWVWSVRDFIFLESAYEGRRAVFYLAISASPQQNIVRALIKATLAMAAVAAGILHQVSAMVGIWVLKISIHSTTCQPVHYQAKCRSDRQSTPH